MNYQNNGETGKTNGRQRGKTRGGIICGTSSMEHFTSNGKKITRGEIKALLPQEILDYGDVPKILKFNHLLIWLCQEDEELLDQFKDNIENHYLTKSDDNEDDLFLDWDVIETIDDLINELKHL